MIQQPVGILGCGYRVPEHTRRNEDPIFFQIKRTVNTRGVSEKDLFTGMKERRFLEEDERVEALMVEAAQEALLQANLAGSEIDRLYGYASVSPYITPNALYEVHRWLHLPQHTLVVPINSEFSNFVLGVIQAWEAILTGHSRYSLVVCGSNWTHYVDYTQGHSLSLGDGAGAAVVGPGGNFLLVDYATQTLSEQYGSMTMRIHRPDSSARRYRAADEPTPTYEITQEAGIESFLTAGMEGPPLLIRSLLEKHDLKGSDIALISHQASRLMLDHWAQQIQPREYLETLEQFGNMTLATCPINLAHYFQRVSADYLVLLALGLGFHQTALLIKRA